MERRRSSSPSDIALKNQHDPAPMKDVEDVNNTKEVSKGRTDMFQESGKLLDAVTKQADEYIDEHTQHLQLKKNNLKEDIRKELEYLFSHSDTKFLNEEWARNHAIAKRFYGPGTHKDLQGIWATGGDWGGVSQNKQRFERYFKDAIQKHQVLENNCNLETIAKIGEELQKLQGPLVYSNPLYKSLITIKSYLEAKAFNIKKADNEWIEISKICRDPNQQTETIEIFRKHLNIQPQEQFLERSHHGYIGSESASSAYYSGLDQALQARSQKIEQKKRRLDLQSIQDTSMNVDELSIYSAIGRWSKNEIADFVKDYDDNNGYLSKEAIDTIKSKNGLTTEERTKLARILYNKHIEEKGTESDLRENKRIYSYLKNYTEGYARVTNDETKARLAEEKHSIQAIGRWSKDEIANLVKIYNENNGYLSEEAIDIIKSKNGLKKEERIKLTRILYNKHIEEKGTESDNNEYDRIRTYLWSYAEGHARATNDETKARLAEEKAEEKARLAEEKAEEKARLAEEKARLAEEKAKEKARLAEERKERRKEAQIRFKEAKDRWKNEQ